MKKSIKRLVIITSAVLAIVLILFAGFSWRVNSLETYQTTFLNSIPGYQGTYKDIWELTMSHPQQTPTESREITFLGKTYVVSYTDTYYTDCLSDTRKNAYTTASKDVEFQFGVDSDRLLGVAFSMTPTWFRMEYAKNDVENPEQYAVSHAKEVASQFVNLDSYQLMPIETSTSSEYDREFTMYYIRFVKVIGGIETTDYVAVNMTSRGSLTAVHFGEIGAFDEFHMTALTKAALNANLNTVAKNAVKKLNKSYVQADYLNHNTETQKICVTPTGQIAVYTKLSITSHLHTDQADQQVTGPLIVTTILTS